MGGLFGLEAGGKDVKSEVLGSCFFGIDSSDHLCFVVECLLCLEAALIAGDSLADDLGVFVDPDIGGGGGGEHAGEDLAKHGK